MPQKLSAQDVGHARELLQSSGPTAMYDFLESKGYKYPVLANGVVKGGAVTGEAALSYLRSVAQEEGKPVSNEQMNTIRADMANAYLTVLEKKIRDNVEIISDLNHEETWNFHKVVFRGHGLPPKAWTLDKDIGFVRPGQTVALKLEAFNYTKYGTIPGEVLNVSQDAIEDEKRGLIYSCRIRLRQDHLMIDGQRVALSPGMAVSAEIKTQQRRVISYLLSPLQRHINEGLRER